jgi:two-component system NtrC family sensor kinase
MISFDTKSFLIYFHKMKKSEKKSKAKSPDTAKKRKQAAVPREAVLETLHQSEERYRTVLENMQEGYFEVDLTGNVTFCNDSLCRIHKRSKNEMMRMNNRQFMDKETSKKVFEAFNRVYKTGEPLPEIDWQIIRNDGVTRYIEASVSLLQDTSGNPLGFRGITRDVTERKKAQENLRESEEKYRNLIERATDGIGIAQDGILLYANERLAQLHGYSVVESIGKPFIDFFAPEEVPKVLDRYNRRMAGEKVPPIYETALKCKDGSRLDVEVNAGMINYKGEKADLVFIRDITERKRTAEKLRKEEQRFRVLAEQSSDIIVFVNREGIVTYENRAIEKSLGVTPEKRIGVNLFERIHPDDLKFATDAFNAFLLDTSSKNINAPIRHIRGRHQDGSWRTFETSASKLINDNIVDTVIINLRDITERKRMEESLRESEERFRSMIQSLSDIIFILDRNGQLTYESPSATRILGYQPGHFIGKSPFTHIHPDDIDQVMKDLDEVFRSVNPGIPTEFRYKKADDTWIYLEALGNNQFENPGIQGIVLISPSARRPRKNFNKLSKVSGKRWARLFKSWCPP